MGRGKKAAVEGTPRCGNLDCDVTGRDKVNKKCARLAVCCCNAECQRRHWRRGPRDQIKRMPDVGRPKLYC